MNCGIEEHTDECLCDVIIKETTPIVIDNLNQMWNGKPICDIFNLSSPWVESELYTFFDKLLQAYDAINLTSSARSRGPLPSRGNESYFTYWKMIRTAVEDIYSETPNVDIVDVLDMLNVEPDEFISAVTSRHRPEWNHKIRTCNSRELLKQVQKEIVEKQVSIYYLENKYSFGKNGSGRWFKKLFGAHQNKGVQNEQTKLENEKRNNHIISYIKQNPELTQQEVVEWAKQEYPHSKSNTLYVFIRRNMKGNS